MRGPSWILALILFISSCRSKDHIPSGVIPQKNMQAIIWDMMRADQFLADFVLGKDSSLDKRTESLRLYQQVLSIHGISSEEFRESFLFYQARPGLMRVIMDSISKRNLIPSPILNTNPRSIQDTIKPLQ